MLLLMIPLSILSTHSLFLLRLMYTILPKVSVVPGTTLNFLKIRLGSKISLYDTPGLFLSHQITSHLNEKELKVVVRFNLLLLG